MTDRLLLQTVVKDAHDRVEAAARVVIRHVVAALRDAESPAEKEGQQ